MKLIKKGIYLSTLLMLMVAVTACNQKIDIPVINLDEVTDETDVAPPLWRSSYPLVSRNSESSFDLTVKISESGKIYYKLIKKGDALPNAENIIANNHLVYITGETEKVITFTDLLAKSDYIVCLLAQDRNGNTANSVEYFPVKTADTTKPEWVSGFPAVSLVTDTMVYCRIKTNEAVTCYYMLTPKDALATMPTADEIINCNNVNYKIGNIATLDDNSSTIAFDELVVSTDYDLYVVAVDNYNNVQLPASVKKVSFHTNASDSVSPAWNAGYPKSGVVTADSLQLKISVNEKATVYYLCKIDGSSAPTALDIKNASSGIYGKWDISADAISLVNLQNIPDLLNGVSYTVYLVAEDLSAVKNLQSTVTVIPFPPVWLSGCPSLKNITESAFGLSVGINEGGLAYYLVVTDGATEPTSLQIKNHSVSNLAYGQLALTANTPADISNITFGSIVAGDNYDVYICASDTTGNLQGTPVKCDIKISDNTAPLWTSTYPKTSAITDTSFKLNLKMGESGKAYYVVVPANSGDLAVADVLAPSGVANKTAAGNVDLTKDTETLIAFNALLPATAYDVYMVAADDEANPNVQTVVTKLSGVTTLADTYPPEWTSGYPKIGTAGSADYSFKVKVAEGGTLYYVVIPDGSVQPGIAQIKDGKYGADIAAISAGTGVVKSNTEALITATGLAPSTLYDLYMVVVDAAGNPAVNTAYIKKLDITTAIADSAPVWSSGYPQKISQSATDAQLKVKLNKNGKLYYVALPYSGTPLIQAAEPSPAQIKSGKDKNNLSVAVSGSVDFTAATEADLNITGLDGAMRYDIYLVAENSQSILQDDPAIVDLAAPEWQLVNATDYCYADNHFSNSTGASVTVHVKSNENGRISYLAYPAGTLTDNPTLQQIILGKIDGQTATKAGSVMLMSKQQLNFAVNNLPAVCSYDIYFTLQDSYGNCNSTIQKITVDVKPPVFTADYPKIENITAAAFDLKIQLDQSGKVYYVLLAEGATAPTGADIKAGNCNYIKKGTISAGLTESSTAITGLTTATHYDLYLVTEDESASGSNLSWVPVKKNIITN